MMVRYTLRGGPNDGQQGDIPLPMCLDTIGVQGKAWFKRLPSGDVAIMSGGKRDSTWLGYNLAVYKKSAPVEANAVEYEFVKTIAVTRCTALTKKGEVCRNDAEPEGTLCKVHMKVKLGH